MNHYPQNKDFLLKILWVLLRVLVVPQCVLVFNPFGSNLKPSVISSSSSSSSSSIQFKHLIFISWDFKNIFLFKNLCEAASTLSIYRLGIRKTNEQIFPRITRTTTANNFDSTEQQQNPKEEPPCARPNAPTQLLATIYGEH